MESLALLESDEPLASMDQQGLKVHQVWLDRQDPLESLDLLGNQEYLELQECLASQDDLERLAKRDLRGYQECQVSRVKWGLLDHSDPRVTKVLREFLVL